MIIKVDSKEKKPLKFKALGPVTSVETVHLSFGDYAAENEKGMFEKVFERKELSDLWGTLTTKLRHERFKREIERAKLAKKKLIIITEGSITDVFAGIDRSKFRGVSMVKMLFTIWVRYGVPTVFCNNRKEMTQFILETFLAENREGKK